ncbi:MAG: hypothetical protein ACKVZ0_14130 [Gemmatimonadales bacterium]
MTVPVFVNERRLTVEAGLSVGEVLGRADPAWLEALAGGRAAVTDGRGIPLDLATPAAVGMIVRVAISARRAE